MSIQALQIEDEDIKEIVDSLNFKEKVERSLALIDEAYKKYGDSLVVANSLGKDSMVIWDMAKRVSPDIKGFIVTTRFKPVKTIEFMDKLVSRYPELKIYKNNQPIQERLYEVDPDICCELLKVAPTQGY